VNLRSSSLVNPPRSPLLRSDAPLVSVPLHSSQTPLPPISKDVVQKDNSSMVLLLKRDGLVQITLWTGLPPTQGLFRALLSPFAGSLPFIFANEVEAKPRSIANRGFSKWRPSKNHLAVVERCGHTHLAQGRSVVRFAFWLNGQEKGINSNAKRKPYSLLRLPSRRENTILWCPFE
jgi:hypothetical protein